MLTKEQILAAKDLNTETVSVPEWGGDVVIRELTGSERDTFEQTTYVRNGKNFEVNMKDMRARLCSMCIVDADGKRMFSDGEIKSLSGKSSRALDRVFSACSKLNGLGKDDQDELSKNSVAAQTDDLLSD